VLVGLKASGYGSWFVELLEGLGHRVPIGDPAEIRRRARRRRKNDRRDATLILDLLRWSEWFSLVEEFDRRIKGLDEWLERRAGADERVTRLRTQPGIRLLTALALVHTLESVTRLGGGRKVAAYIGLEPMEYSSGGKQRFGSISKGGSRLLRYLLVEAARITVRRDEELKRFYQPLLGRRGSQKARVAVARKLLVRGYIFLREGLDYAEFLRRGVEARPARAAT
jgi:transposase